VQLLQFLILQLLTSTKTGALTVAGGVGVQGDVFGNAFRANGPGGFGFIANNVVSGMFSPGNNGHIAFVNAGVENVRIISNGGNVGIGTTTPTAKLTIGTPLTGSILSTTVNTNAGTIESAVGSELNIANFGGMVGNSASLGVSLYKTGSVNTWDNAALLLGYDVDNTKRAGGYISMYSGNVGIGTDTPSSKLHVVGDALVSSLAGNSSRMVVADAAGKMSAAAIPGSFWTASNQTNNNIYSANSGNVGIGTSGPGYKLEVISSVNWIASFSNTSGANPANGIIISAGSNTASGSELIRFTRPTGAIIGSVTQNTTTSVAYNTTSDIRLKENIKPTTFDLENLMKLKVVDYNYIGDNSAQTGLIAQEAYEIIPSVVTVGGDDVKTNPWGIDYGKLTPYLIKAVQEQQSLIEGLKTENQGLKTELELLKTEFRNEINNLKYFVNFPKN